MLDIILGALCEYRAPSHYEAHGGLKADSLWHMQQGELPTCNPDGSPVFASRDDSEPWSDDPGSYRRDEFGLHCGILGCG